MKENGSAQKTPAAAARKPAKRVQSKPATRVQGKPAKPARRKRKPATNIYGVAPTITDEASLAEAVIALRARDPEGIGHMLEVAGPPPLRLREPGFAGLVAIVISQQVSVESANAIHARLAAAFTPLDPAAIAAAGEAVFAPAACPARR